VPPFPDSRMAYYRIQHAQQAQHIPDGPTAMILRGQRFSPRLVGFDFGSPDSGAKLSYLLPVLCRIGNDRLRGEQRLLNQQLPGDFVVDANASREQIVAALNPILQKVQPQPVSVKLQDTEEEVFVARGTYQLSDTAQQRGLVLIEGTLIGTANSAEDALENKDQAPRARFDDFLASLAKAVGSPIVSEVESPPSGRIPFHTLLGNSLRAGADFDPQPVLDAVTQQTGLTFTKERRRIQTLLVEEVR
jgi:hypothetical protein